MLSAGIRLINPARAKIAWTGISQRYVIKNEHS